MELRNYIESDAHEIIKWIEDERALKLWSADIYGDFPTTANDINDNYVKCISSSNFYPMTLIDNNKVVGHITLRNPNPNCKEIVRLGFIIIDGNLRGKGYGKKLIQEAIHYSKTILNSKEINLGVFENNTNAFYCYKSVGFKEIHTDKNVFQFHNETWNCIEMILKD